MASKTAKERTINADSGLRPKLLAETIKALYGIKRTVCIEGPPGGGKTSLVQQVAKDLGIEYIEVHMPTKLVEDFGIPMPVDDGHGNKKLEYVIPEWFPTDPNWKGILCFDDRNQASTDLQKVLANICQARNLHNVKLSPGAMVVSTGNRQSDRAGANRILSHLRNRETVIPMLTDLDEWTSWALNNGVAPEVVAFIRFKPGLLHDFDPQREANATPRSWVEGVSAALGTVPLAAEYECFKGAVGEGAAAEFVAFMKVYRELPNPDAVIADPLNHKLYDTPAVLYALSAALAHRANDKNFKAIVQYMSRCPGEFSVLCISMAVKREQKLAHTKAFTDWAVEHESVVF